jgi:hypothetical protein
VKNQFSIDSAVISTFNHSSGLHGASTGASKFSFFSFLGKIPARFNVAVMLFMACFTAYMLRTNISINLIAMVQDSNNSTNGSLPDVSQVFVL